MNAKPKPQRVPTQFGHDTRFELVPHLGPFAGARAQRTFEQLKSRLLEPMLEPVADTTLRRELALAANEAAAVAWTTPFPLLVLPVLLEEKAAEARRYAARREGVRNVTDSFAGAAA